VFQKSDTLVLIWR